MREEFTNAISQSIVFTDAGVEIHCPNAGDIFFPYGSIEKINFSFFVGFEIQGHDKKYTIPGVGKDKQRLKEMIDFAQKAMRIATPAVPTEMKGYKEHYMRCNVCGKVFCYSDADLIKNERRKQEVYNRQKSAALNALGGTLYSSYEQQKLADSAKSQIVDYSKCPNCNSTNLEELSVEEAEKLQKQNNSGTSVLSAADELKKFKELLDMGVITQEEFDAKKKELLGL